MSPRRRVDLVYPCDLFFTGGLTFHLMCQISKKRYTYYITWHMELCSKSTPTGVTQRFTSHRIHGTICNLYIYLVIYHKNQPFMTGIFVYLPTFPYQFTIKINHSWICRYTFSSHGSCLVGSYGPSTGRCFKSPKLDEIAGFSHRMLEPHFQPFINGWRW